MKTLIGFLQHCRNRQRIPHFIVLLGCVLFFSLSPAASHGKTTFSGHEDHFNSCNVNWYSKTHNYVGLHIANAVHNYQFRGKWTQMCTSAETGVGFYQHWNLDVKGSWSAETNKIHEVSTFTGKVPTHGGYYLDVEIIFVTEGTSILDPWQVGAGATSPGYAITTRCEKNRWTYPNGGISDVPPYQETPPILVSRCAYTDKERHDLSMVKPTPLACTEEQIRQKPIVIMPKQNSYYNDYRQTIVHVEMHCRPFNPAHSFNRFNYNLEQRNVEPDGTASWIKICDVCGINMVSSDYNYITKGVKNLNLEQPGRYRIKFSQQAGTEKVDTGGPSTDWIEFTAGPLPIIKPEAKSIPKALPRPDLTVYSVAFNPAQPKAGQNFEIKIVFVNKGTDSTKPNQGYLATFTRQAGGAPIMSPGPHAITQPIKPNQSFAVTRQASIKEPGIYLLTVKPQPGSGEAKVALTIAPAMEMIPKPGTLPRK